MRKLLATDLDGTLLKDNKVTEENNYFVYKLQKEGNLLVISTGRPYNGIGMLKEESNIIANYYILLNGALVVDSLGNIIEQRFIEKDIIENILENVFDDNTFISLESGYVTYILTEGDDLPYPIKIRVNSFKEIKENISLITMYSPKKEINEIENIKNNINEKYGDSIIAYRNDKYIDIVPLGCSKGNALRDLIEKEQITEENVYAIGDSWNDVSMFEAVKHSFTFHYAEDELKRHSKYIVSSVAECIEKFILVN